MSDFEFEFNQQDKDLVLNQTDGTFSGLDYIRLTIYPTEAINNIVTLPDSNEQAIFYSSLNESDFAIDISPFGAGLDNPNYKTIGGSENDFQIYKNGDDIYIKPNEIFNQFELPEGNYKIQIDFLNQVRPGYSFIIRQISTSRKEVRLKFIDVNIQSNSSIITQLPDTFNTDDNGNVQDKYQFRHVLNIGTGIHIPIMNYAFDPITDGKDNQSIILKLYEPLSTNIQDLSLVTIEREVLTTQTQDIFYFSDVPDIFFGDGLLPDTQENWINPDGNDIGFENLNQLAFSASIGDVEIETLLSQSQYGYPNLNTDYTKFENHTHFGSAKKKLENFKTKVETIQGHYSNISESLFSSGVDVGGDSSFVVQKRKNLFEKINKEFKTFSPYENFLYFDGQSESTASSVGLGKNYARINPVKTADNYEKLNQKDGFKVVYKNSSEGETTGVVNLFDNQYKVQDKPFFNYSSSIYLSFVLKGTDNLQINRTIDNHLASGHQKNKFRLPHDTMHTSSILQPNVVSDEYRRFVFEASASYFVPNTNDDDMAELDFSAGDFSPGSDKINIIDGTIKTGSSNIKDSTNVYPTTVTTQSGVPFEGSIMPAGDLFVINYTSGSVLSQSFVTDVRVSLNNPTNVLPFDVIYESTSTEWTTWYNTLLTQAETFDTDNIHSLENNLPLYIQESSEYNDLKDFLSLQGEQYDLIKNHIDSMGTIHKRGYKKTDSPPDNTLPVVMSNMGWEAINPFTGSLTETVGNYLSGVSTIDDIKNNTWRKTLNNLIHIYKSKGTRNSVRALLNVYGYPPDVINFQEFGGSTEESNPRIFTNNPPISPNGDGIDLNLENSTGSFSFISKKKKLYTHKFGGDTNKIVLLDWYYNDANANTLEFVYKHIGSSRRQNFFVSKAADVLDVINWDLSVVPSTGSVASGLAGAPTAISYSFEFRLNNSETGSLAIADNAISMSTPFIKIPDGQLWNVMLQRMTASDAGVGAATSATSVGSTINEYRLHAALQEGKTIKKYQYVALEVSGGLSTDSNHRANQNFVGSGSRLSALNQNLHVGGQIPDDSNKFGLSGSLGEIRAWSTALSASKFRQHTLNKFSTVGNTINSHKDELIYHFKLNENYTTSSLNSPNVKSRFKYIDSAPTTTFSDYTFTDGGEVVSQYETNKAVYSSSIVYGNDIIDTVQLTTQDNSQKANNNNIIINTERVAIGNLDAFTPAVESLTNPFGKKPRIKTSNKLEIYRSPQSFIDDFILDKLSGFDLETLYGNPLNYYSQSYGEFDTFRENFFDAYPVTVDTNKFIRAHEDMFNHSIIEVIKKVIPARTTFTDKYGNVGVEIKPTVLEKQKYENEEHSVEANPNTGNGSIDVVSTTSVISSHYQDINIDVKEGTIQGAPSNSGSLELPLSVTIKVSDSGSFGNPYLGVAYTSVTSSIVNPFSSTINMLQQTTKILSSSGETLRYDKTHGVTLEGSTVVTSKDGTIDYASIANKSYTSVHKNWGTSSNDTHFINYFNIGTNSDYNTYHIDDRFVFHTIGDTEYFSASIDSAGSSDFANYKKFYNRLYLSDGVDKNVNYDGLDFGADSIDGIVTGRMMGKTRYFITASDGNITLPSNHVTKFSNPFKEQMINGTQNTNPGQLNVRYEDYSTASFYRVTVTGGDNQIRIQSGNPGLGSDDKIIYDDGGAQPLN